MTSGVGQVQLQDTLKKLLQRWDDTQAFWDDKVRREFQDRFIQPLLDQLKTTMQAMDDLSRTMQACYQDCK
jgi:hypothetical protein